MNWWEKLYLNWLPGGDVHWERDWEMMGPWVSVRYDVATRLQPKTIVEIGVRAGYSAFAFLSACPAATYLGIDSYPYPGYSDLQTHYPHALALLALFPEARTSIMLQDSHALKVLPIRAPDLVHVDGDHSYQGCLNDCFLALASDAKYILVDDTTGIPEVARAVQDFTRRFPACQTEQVDSGQQGATLITFQKE